MKAGQSTSIGGSSIVEPVFLVGTTRSGTTLLSLMLGHHEQISFVGELAWVWDFDPSSTAPSLEPYYEWLTTHRHFLHHKLSVDQSLEFSDMVRSFLEQMRADVDPNSMRPIVGCQVHRHYEKALSIWPRARFIHIVRDGRDVCASWIKFGWLGNGYEGGLRWREALAEWANVRSRIDPGRRIELRFEDLIKFPERELERLCKFLGTSFSVAMLRYHENSTYEQVDPMQANKWREQLAVRDVRLFESVAVEDLALNGYALSGWEPYRLLPWSHSVLRIEGKLKSNRARMRIYGPWLWLADILTRWLGVRSLWKRVRIAMNQVEDLRAK